MGFYCVLLGFIRFYWVFIGFQRSMKVFTEFNHSERFSNWFLAEITGFFLFFSTELKIERTAIVVHVSGSWWTSYRVSFTGFLIQRPAVAFQCDRSGGVGVGGVGVGVYSWPARPRADRPLFFTKIPGRRRLSTQSFIKSDALHLFFYQKKRFFRVEPSFTGFYWVLLGFTGFDWVRLGWHFEQSFFKKSFSLSWKQ